MKNKKMKGFFRRLAPLLIAAVITLPLLLGGCSSGGGTKIKLDPKNPVTITIWHYYNGAIMNAFEAMIRDFNETVGAKEGIIVESFGHGSVSELEKAVMASANREVGSKETPNVFASYADTAYAAEAMNILANLDDYFTKEEQQEYVDSFIEEGRIGANGELKIFPIAKSTEIFMLNDTDWQPFAAANGFTYNDLESMEGVAAAAKAYYEWTDSLTPEVAGDGKAFFGRDGMANLFIIAAKEFGAEIFKVEGSGVAFNIDENVMRAIWDSYYVPYISGYFSAYGRFRSDDTKVGDIIAYVGSTASASYFPSEVTVGGSVYPVEAGVFPAPYFAGGAHVMVQQGAGMVVTKSTPQEEYASAVFLKWFTQTKQNVEFASLSGYMPVRKEAIDYDTFMSIVEEAGLTIDEMAERTLKVALEEMKTGEMYTNKAFEGGAAARAVLDYNLQDKAVADRTTVLELIAGGSTHEEAVAQFATDENFKSWLEEFKAKLDDAVK